MTIQPNHKDMQCHLDKLFSRCENDYPGALIQIDSAKENGHWSSEYFNVGERDKAVEYAAKENLDGRNVYVGVNPRKPDTFVGRSATDKDILCAYYNFSDHDNVESTDKLKKNNPIPYSFVVTTGRTPTPRVHAYWERETPLPNLGAWTTVQSGLVERFDSDKVIDPRRIMRLAGTVSYPDTKKCERGYTTELVTIKTKNKQPVNGVELYNKFPVCHAAGGGEGGASPAGLNLPAFNNLDVDKIAKDIMDGGGEWHNNMIRVVAHWVSQGKTNAEILIMARNFTQAGYNNYDTDKEVAVAIEGARRKYNAPEPTEAGIKKHFEEKHEGDISAFAVDADALNPTNLPTRQFIYGRHLIENYVATTISPGGVGKTTIALTDAIAIATGRQLTHDDVHKKCKVWHYNLEDPKDELLRRVIAIQKHFNIKKEDLIGELFINSGRDQRLIVADKTQQGVIATPHAEQLTEAILKNGIKVLSIDPFVKSHYADENDNKQIDDVLQTYGQIAHDTNCAIDLVHHVRKPPQANNTAAGDINQARGASALSGAVRSARTVTVMTEKEADLFGIRLERRHWFIRLDDAKANMSPPSAGAYWLERHSIHINNAAMGDGDSVGVVSPWTPPDAFDGITPEKAREILLAINQQLCETGRWSNSKQAGKRWVGNLIMDMAIDKSEGDAKQIIKTWMESGVLFEDEYLDEQQRKQRKCVEVDLKLLPKEVN